MTELRNPTVIVARPQFVKAAGMSRACAAADRIGEILVHAGLRFYQACRRCCSRSSG